MSFQSRPRKQRLRNSVLRNVSIQHLNHPHWCSMDRETQQKNRVPSLRNPGNCRVLRVWRTRYIQDETVSNSKNIRTDTFLQTRPTRKLNVGPKSCLGISKILFYPISTSSFVFLPSFVEHSRCYKLEPQRMYLLYLEPTTSLTMYLQFHQSFYPHCLWRICQAAIPGPNVAPPSTLLSK